MTGEHPNAHRSDPRQQGVARLGEEQERQVREFVEAVVRRTRLWRDERNEVRMELLHHFDDGVDAGRSLEQLFADFGIPHIAARMIRVSKMRNRSWNWHVRHRVLQIFAASVCVMLGCLLILLARLHLAWPGLPHDDIGQFDLVNHRVPREERGWPDYRQGLMLLDRTPLRVSGTTPALDLRGQPTDPHWGRLVSYLEANAKSLDLFVQGSQRPRLGYIYRDPTNDPWLKVVGGRTAAETYPIHVTRYETLLPHYQDLGYIRSLLYSAAIRALENKDLPSFRKYWQAQLRLAAQVLKESEFIVVRSIGSASTATALALLRSLVIDHSELLSNEQLADYLRDLDGLPGASKGSTESEFRTFFEEFLQTTYTAQTDSGGRLTVAGCQTLRRRLSEVSPHETLKCAALLAEKEAAGLDTAVGIPVRNPSSLSAAWMQEMTALRWSTNLANRRDLRLEMERLLTLLQSELDKPVALCRENFEGSAYLTELQRIVASPDELRRYWPVFLVLPTSDYTYWPERSQESLKMLHDGTLATVALEQYRRRTGKWPERLEQLVPADLPHVPQDIYSGKPLIYRVVADKPLLYSVWRDRDDDGGKPLPKETTGDGPHDGDFRLLPVD